MDPLELPTPAAVIISGERQNFMETNTPNTHSRQSLLDAFHRIRKVTEDLCSGLEVEDYLLQTMPDVSPLRWHLAHTAWFFETFLLKEYRPGYKPLDDKYNMLFNSYYNAVGEQFPRPLRGTQSRPTVKEIYAYRKHVDQAMAGLIREIDPNLLSQIEPLVVLGLNHEQQHQELMLTDLKHAFGSNPLFPVYSEVDLPRSNVEIEDYPFLDHQGGMIDVGHTGPEFAFDNEDPRHQVFIQDYGLGQRLITNGEYLKFIQDGGYDQAMLWLSDGWAMRHAEGWESPLYWHEQDGEYFEFTLHGLQKLDLNAPVTHISLYEADAFASWMGVRLPTEFEWENAASHIDITGHFMGDQIFHPQAAPAKDKGLSQMFGDVWEWTRSPYTPYPGFRAPKGAVGEYNGKFMANQFVLKGGSCASSQNHLRASYRNFFHPHCRWQFMGLRLAKDI